jgi:hypothetical protein
LYRYISDCRLCSIIWIKDKESVAKYSCKQSITIYQLAHLIIFELPKIIEQFSSTSKIIVIYYLLHLFVSDTHTDKVDAKNLTKGIASSLRKISEYRFIIVSFVHCNIEYQKLLLPVFDNCIEITNNIDDDKILQIDINNLLLYTDLPLST